jgi:hypothetical protein
MYELTYKDGMAILATYVEGIGFFDLHGFQLKDGCWINCVEL